MSFNLNSTDKKLDQILNALCCLTQAVANIKDYESVMTPPVCIDGTWQYVIVIYEDGVEIQRENLDTGVSCDDAPPTPLDFEIKDRERCDATTGTIWKQCVAYYFADSTDPATLTSMDIGDEVDTGIVCNVTNIPPIDIPLCLTDDDEVVDPPEQVWTLFSKFLDPHPDAANYAGIVHIGELGSGSNDPDQGFDLSNWNVFAVCSATQPADDSNQHFWRLGDPSSFTWANFTSGPNPSPSC